MDKKSKRELLQIVEEKEKNIVLYKTRLRDIIESYKHLQKEKEILESSINTLAENEERDENSELSSHSTDCSDSETKDKKDMSIKRLKNNLRDLTAEKTRIENELFADRKKILQQKDELEKKLFDCENNWFLEKGKLESHVQEFRKRVSVQQREREKEQQDHVMMLKELQNLLATERATKERFENQLIEMQQKAGLRITEKKISEYEKIIEDFQNKMTISQDKLRSSENEVKRNLVLLENFQDEMKDLKSQYIVKVTEEKDRADVAEEKLRLLTLVKEKRITSLENKISELSATIGDHDKLQQQDQITIQKLKAKNSQLQIECTAFSSVPIDDMNVWELESSGNHENPCLNNKLGEKLHVHCQSEISRLTEEIELWKTRAEARLNEKIQKTSSFFADSKTNKELKELKIKNTQLQDQLHMCKSQLKLNEEYHEKITTNLEKSCEDLRLQQKQQLNQMEVTNRAQLLELEYQIQKQRERTLSLLEEKDKEIGQLKSSFLSSFIKKEDTSLSIPPTDKEMDLTTPEQETTASLLPNSLISSKKDGHILHYLQELSRKDIEISNLRQSRIQTESALRKLQQTYSMMQMSYTDDVESLQSRIKLLESSQDEKGMNVEYLKNVVLRFLKCSDPASRRHMFNAIATVLHFTSNEVQDIKLM